MKKKLALILSLCMLCGTSAAAQTIDKDTTGGEQSAEVTYSVDSSYTVTIPESVTIDSTDGKGTGEVSIAANPILPAGTSYVWVGVNTGAHWGGTTLQMALETDSDYKLKYEITMSGNLTKVWPNNEKNTPFLQLRSGSTESTTLTFSLSEPVKVAGTYKDLLTFWVKPSKYQSINAN